MLTPQDIQEQEFSKAVFGGYDMAAVDDFLEKVNSDYAALYKENAILKGKIKVLVEKVEEYRSTEDAMRMALLTAQKMGDDIIAETKEKTDKQLEDTRREIEAKKASFQKEYADELARLEAAKAQTIKFIQASQEIMQQHEQFLAKLDSVTQENSPVKQAAVNDEEDELIQSPEPEPHRDPIPEPDDDMENKTIRDIDAVVSEVMESGYKDIEEPEADEPTKVIGVSAGETLDADDSPTRRITWTEEDEAITPRPKFDFSDLKFGTNYSEEDK